MAIKCCNCESETSPGGSWVKIIRTMIWCDPCYMKHFEEYMDSLAKEEKLDGF